MESIVHLSGVCLSVCLFFCSVFFTTLTRYIVDVAATSLQRRVRKLMSNSHRPTRRDKTVEIRRVGSGGVNAVDDDSLHEF